MKTRLLSPASLIAVLIACLSLPVTAAPGQIAPTAFSVRAVTQDHERIIERGNTAVRVLQRLGSPQRKLDDDTWVYFNFRGSDARTAERGCTSLVVTLARNRVSSIKLVNDRALAILAANLEQKGAAEDGAHFAGK